MEYRPNRQRTGETERTGHTEIVQAKPLEYRPNR